MRKNNEKTVGSAIMRGIEKQWSQLNINPVWGVWGQREKEAAGTATPKPRPSMQTGIVRYVVSYVMSSCLIRIWINWA